MMVKNLREFIFENYYKKTGFIKKDSYYLMKKNEKIYIVLFATKIFSQRFRCRAHPFSRTTYDILHL